jgi:cardiolipin synthase
MPPAISRCDELAFHAIMQFSTIHQSRINDLFWSNFTINWALIYLISEWTIRFVMLAYVPQKRSPAAARAWLLLVFIFPWGGLLLYWTVGRPRLPARLRQMQQRASAMIREVTRDIPDPDHVAPANCPEYEQVVRLASNLGNFPLLPGNEVQLLADYQGSIDRLIADINSARRHVHLQYYIFGNDATGRRVIDALLQAAARGVACRLMYDSVGTGRAFAKLAARLREGKVEVVELLPVRWLRRNFTRPDLRNHRKIVVIDGWIGYVGSQNIVDAGFRAGFVNEELVARVTGPVVSELQTVFLTDYSLETGKVSADRAFFPADNLAVNFNGDSGGASLAQILPSGPGYDQENTECMIVDLMHAAKKQVILTTPYFVPDEPLLLAMRTAVLRGVEVHLVVSRKPDHIVVGLAQQSYYDELLGMGIRIHRYTPGLLHAKHVSVDDTLALVGSSNLDIRSFALNAEVSLIIYDPTVVAALRKVQDRNMSMADLLAKETWARRPGWQKFLQNTARLVDSVL